MKKPFNYFLWLVAVALLLFLLSPLFVQTTYVSIATQQDLNKGYILKQDSTITIKAEIPEEYLEKDQCIDIWFTSTKGQPLFTLTDFSLHLFDNGIELKSTYEGLFWDNDSKEKSFKITNYPLRKYVTANDSNRFVFARNSYDLSNAENLDLYLKAKYSINAKADSLEQKFSIKKSYKFVWPQFRVH